jgi:hypothetical protein
LLVDHLVGGVQAMGGEKDEMTGLAWKRVEASAEGRVRAVLFFSACVSAYESETVPMSNAHHPAVVCGIVASVETSLHAMRVASRVLLATGERRDPPEEDIEELRRLEPLMAHLPADELACEVIQQALKRREKLRSSA